MEGHTTGEVIFDAIVSFFEENKLDLGRINMQVTDGASAIAGRIQGPVLEKCSTFRTAHQVTKLHR